MRFSSQGPSVIMRCWLNLNELNVCRELGGHVWNLIWPSVAPVFVYSAFLFQVNQSAVWWFIHSIIWSVPARLDPASFHFVSLPLTFRLIQKVPFPPLFLSGLITLPAQKFGDPFLLNPFHSVMAFSFHYNIIYWFSTALFCLRWFVAFKLSSTPLWDCKLFEGRNSCYFSPFLLFPLFFPYCVHPTSTLALHLSLSLPLLFLLFAGLI